MTHIFPDNEKHLHEESTTCVCSPVVDYDDNTGQMFVFHMNLTVNLQILPDERKDIGS